MTTPQKGRIFISYRRADSAGYAGRIYDRLSAHFGVDAVFMDVDTIEAGVDFLEVLQNSVQSCDVVVVLVGRNWLTIKDETSKRRLDNPEDFVRIEIATALNRDIRVIPVLVDGAQMPSSAELPDNLKPLVRRNALQVNHHSFNANAHRLIAQLELALKAAEDSKILKVQALKEKQARAQRQSKIERALSQADLAISLKDWILAREKLNDVLALDGKHVGAQAKLDIVQSKISELEQEEAEKTQAEKEAREKAAAEERARLAAKQQAQDERKKHERQARLSNLVSQVASQEDTKTGKPAWRLYGIGGGVVLVCAILFGIGYLALNALTPTSPSESLATPTVTSEELGVGSTMVSEIDGMVMVYVPAGEFKMGSEDGDDDEKPVHTVYLDAFWIDQTEVTNAMYVKCVDAGDCDEPMGTTHYGDGAYNNHPVVYVSWNDSSTYCTWADRRLPTEAEWEKAARGGLEGKAYPWGDTIPVCERGAENGAQFNNCDGQTIPVGSFGQNGYGLYDMAGNVSEWVSGLFQSYPYSATNGSDNVSVGGMRVLRGGAWSYRADDVRSASRTWLDPAVPSNVFGFRCARDATP